MPTNFSTLISGRTKSLESTKAREYAQSRDYFTVEDQEEDSSPPDSGRRRKMKKRPAITGNVTYCKYELVKRSMEALGMTLLKDETPGSHSSFVFWHDSVVPTEKIQDLKSYQHINHFPSMGEICRKDYLARNMAKMHRARPNEFNFAPKSWLLPAEYNLLLLHAKDCKKKNRKSPTFIQKPANGAMGNGIQLFRNVEKIPPTDHTIVQEYLDKPLLLDGYKIDLRLYALVTHCDPLRLFLFQDGLVRLGTEKYANPTENNMDQLFMHLTNYSVNKQNENFERHSDFDRGSKRSVKSLMRHLQNAGYDTATLWRNITDLVVKTLIVASPYLLHSYRMCRPGQPSHSNSVCFEILGFDIFLDRKLKPWLLEVNRAPSFGGDEKIDQNIKGGVVRDALALLNIRSSDKRKNLASQKAEAQRRLFRPSHHRLTAGNLSSSDQRKFIVNRRKEELKEKLACVRKAAIKEEFENAHLGGYSRIFPTIDKKLQEKYMSLLSVAFQLFLQSRSAPFQKNIIEQYSPQEENDILDLIEQCEAEEGIRPEPKQLSSMPTLTPPTSRSSRRRGYSTSTSSSGPSSEDEGYGHHVKSSPEAEKAAYLARHGSSRPRVNFTAPSRGQSRSSTRVGEARPSTASRLTHERVSSGRKPKTPQIQTSKSAMEMKYLPLASSYTLRNDSRLSTRPSYRRHGNTMTSSLRMDDAQALAAAVQEREQEKTERTLAALERTRIKFPGKSDKEADALTENIMNHWKLHKPMVASYWLVKLDSSKRKKVVDIVKGNVRAVMQRVWRSSDLETLRLMRLFNRVFNRMHSTHGQGLWCCFSTSGTSWETIFSKSTDTVSATELECCRRIVQLCKDCLLIVYQFANDSRTLERPPPAKENDKMPRYRSSIALNHTNNSSDITINNLPKRFSRGLETANSRRHVTNTSPQFRPTSFALHRAKSESVLVRS